jgi:signal transduction histidine kinase
MRVPWKVAAVLVVAMLTASTLSTLLAANYVRSGGREPHLFTLAVLNGTFWFGWLLLSVPLIQLCRWLRLDRRPRIAVPVHIVGILVAAVTHVALQTASRTYLSWNSIWWNKPEFLAEFSWTASWQRTFPLVLTELIDWELIAGAAIIGIAHALFYYRESQERALRAAHLETELVAAQLQTLQSQLHPHFLFNTLHAISALMHQNVAAADRMLARLSELLRLTLNSIARPEVRLSEELEFIEKYLQIEQVRLGDRLTTEYFVDADTLDAVVPAMVLQPLVENAIKHGIAPYARPGRITISAKREAEMLVLTVDDSGPGPSEHALAALSTGIGVSNTRARLQHQFGARFRFEFRRRDAGFRVLVAIPFREDPPVAAAPAHVA